MTIKTDVSFGEFLDKLTILQIKSERIKDAAKLKNIKKELTLLQSMWAGSGHADADISSKLQSLKAVNEKLWQIEDDIRDKERHGEFDLEFIELARAVYFNNDERAGIKRAINLKLGSDLIEEKSYADYK